MYLFKKYIFTYLTISTTSCIIRHMTTTIHVKQRVTLFLKPETVIQAKAQALVEMMSLTALIERALTHYLPKETIIRKAKKVND